MTTWILVGDASRARIYEAATKRRFRLVRAYEHPQSRKPTRELVSDRPGKMKQRHSDTLRSAMDPQTDAHQVEIARFADELADALRRGLARNAYDEVILAAPPRFLGMLRARLNAQVARRVIKALPSDLTSRTERALVAELGEQVTAIAR